MLKSSSSCELFDLMSQTVTMDRSNEFAMMSCLSVWSGKIVIEAQCNSVGSKPCGVNKFVVPDVLRGSWNLYSRRDPDAVKNGFSLNTSAYIVHSSIDNQSFAQHIAKSKITLHVGVLVNDTLTIMFGDRFGTRSIGLAGMPVARYSVLTLSNENDDVVFVKVLAVHTDLNRFCHDQITGSFPSSESNNDNQHLSEDSSESPQDLQASHTYNSSVDMSVVSIDGCSVSPNIEHKNDEMNENK